MLYGGQNIGGTAKMTIQKVTDECILCVGFDTFGWWIVSGIGKNIEGIEMKLASGSWIIEELLK